LLSLPCNSTTVSSRSSPFFVLQTKEVVRASIHLALFNDKDVLI